MVPTARSKVHEIDMTHSVLQGSLFDELVVVFDGDLKNFKGSGSCQSSVNNFWVDYIHRITQTAISNGLYEACGIWLK